MTVGPITEGKERAGLAALVAAGLGCAALGIFTVLAELLRNSERS